MASMLAAPSLGLEIQAGSALPKAHSSSSVAFGAASALRVPALRLASDRRKKALCRSTPELPEEAPIDGEDDAEEVPIETSFPEYPTVLDVDKIMEILPHRFPFLLVDRVIEYKPGETAVGIKNVTINDNFFPGHFPQRPLMPGVLMVEAMAQVGGIVMLQPEVGGSKQNFFFVGVDKVRFRRPLRPGDTLVMRMTLVSKRFGLVKMEGKAYVGKTLACEGEFTMALGK